MAKAVENKGTRRGLPWRVIGWGTAALLLLLPLGAMQVSEEVNWSAADFLFMGVMVGITGLGFELIVRKSVSLAYRAGGALALLAAFLTICANAAVGMIGSEDNPLNLMFGGVLLVALAGAVLARLKPDGLSRAMFVTASAQVAAGAVGYSSDPRGAIFSAVFALPWLAAAAAFRSAAQARNSEGSAA